MAAQNGPSDTRRKPPRRRKVGNDDALIIELARGSTVEYAATQAGMSRETAHRRLKDPAVVSRLIEFKRDRVRAVSGSLDSLATEAVRVLFNVMTDATATNSEKIAAATAALRFSQPFWIMSSVEDRLAAIEAEDTRRQAIGELG